VPDTSNLDQTMDIIDNPGSHPYTLRPDDIEACRKILKQLLADDEITGGYCIGSVQGYQGKAQVMIEFVKRCDALSAGQIAARAADCASNLGTLAKKVIAHYDTHKADTARLAKLEELYAAWQDFDRYNEEDVPESVWDRWYEAREALQ
jgi:hypothetical protein